jgi:transcriptional regulator with XRE-family HTH domain
VNAASILRSARSASGLGLRELARRAGTSHATLHAYEHGSKVPTVDTLDRIVRAAGFVVAGALLPTVGGADRAARGEELREVLDLAAMFPARHAPTLQAPRFGRS